MPRTLLLLLPALAAGCVSTPQPGDAPPASAVRISLLQQVEPLLVKALTAEGFAVSPTEVTETAVAARNSGDAWDLNRVTVVFSAAHGDTPPARLTTEQEAAAMENFRVSLRRLILNWDGTVLSSSQGENYQERTLSVAYTVPGVVGTVEATLRPASDVPEETRNRFDITVREQAGK